MPLPPPGTPCLAAVGADLVVLDLAADAYFCLPDVVDRDGSNGDPKLTAPGATALREAGYVLPFASDPDEAAPVLSPPIARPTRDLRDRTRARIRADHLLSAGLALVDLARCGDDPTTARLLALAAPRDRVAPEPPTDAGDLSPVHDAAHAFSELLPWLPFEGACLRRSALLVAFLRRRGLTARWVFGVRTWPFRAHCWVQRDDVCLNDDVERLSAYTPILAL